MTYQDDCLIHDLQNKIEELEEEVDILKERLDQACYEGDLAAILLVRTYENHVPDAISCGWYLDERKPDNVKVAITLSNESTGKQLTWRMSNDASDLAEEHLNKIQPNWDGTFSSKSEEIFEVDYD